MFKFWKRSKNKSRDNSGQEMPQNAGESPEPEHEPVPIKFDVSASLQTDVGCVREINEDCIRFVQPADPGVVATKGLLFLVADGMGGHSGGEVASSMAIDVISREYYSQSGNPQSALKKAFNQASRQVFEVSEKDAGLKGMGTTCTALVLRNGSALAAHVGDSRLYLVRGGQIYLMTEDHSEVMEMVKRGLITLEEARHHPDKNVILRAIGSHAEVEVSVWDEPLPVREGDRFLLCSDGLYDLVEDDEIRQRIEKAEPQAACESLIALAKERGGHDNISVGIVTLLPIAVPETREVRPTREMEAVS
jgi:protein phosphatase